MRQVCAAASWLFGCLAVALLAVGILAVSPQAAFADSGSCEEQCAAQCGAIYEEGTFGYYYCMNGCVYQCQMQQLTDCSAAGCQSSTGGCTSQCLNDRCDQNDQNKQCLSTASGCMCS